MQNQLLWEWKDTNEVVDDIKFSPSGEWLAAASHDNHIYMYSMADGKLQEALHVTLANFLADPLHICQVGFHETEN